MLSSNQTDSSVCPGEGWAIEVADFCFSKKHKSDGAYENVCRAHVKQSQTKTGGPESQLTVNIFVIIT